ncbi:unnamed protein product [Rhizophagus irregularis]|nr:unnamed protein product [Rhizophagus irregularis]
MIILIIIIHMRIGRKEKSKAIINNDAEIPKDLFEGTSSDYDATGENLDEYNSYVDSDEDDPELQESHKEKF